MTQEIKTHSNKSNARRAARGEGLDLDTLTFDQNTEGRWFYLPTASIAAIVVAEPAAAPVHDFNTDNVVQLVRDGQPVGEMERWAGYSEAFRLADETGEPIRMVGTQTGTELLLANPGLTIADVRQTELVTVATPAPRGWDSIETESDAVILAEAANTDRPGESAEIAAEAAPAPRRWDSVERMMEALTAPSGCTMVELWKASGWKARPGTTTLAALEKSKGFTTERFELDGKKRVRAVFPAQSVAA